MSCTIRAILILAFLLLPSRAAGQGGAPSPALLFRGEHDVRLLPGFGGTSDAAPVDLPFTRSSAPVPRSRASDRAENALLGALVGGAVGSYFPGLYVFVPSCEFRRSGTLVGAAVGGLLAWVLATPEEQPLESSSGEQPLPSRPQEQLPQPPASIGDTLVEYQLQFLETGTRVRIYAPQVEDEKLVGHVHVLSSDSVFLTRGRRPGVSIPLDAVEGVEISAGRDRLRGALYGAAGGTLVVGGLIALANSEAANPTHAATFALQLGVLGGALPGAAIGALIGVEEWETFTPAPQVSIAPSGDGAIAVTLSFPVVGW